MSPMRSVSNSSFSTDQRGFPQRTTNYGSLSSGRHQQQQQQAQPRGMLPPGGVLEWAAMIEGGGEDIINDFTPFEGSLEFV